MRDGSVVAQGRPADVVTAQTVRAVHGLERQVVPDPVCGTPVVVPLGRRHRGAPAASEPAT